MDMNQLKQWMDMTKQYQAQGFWNEIFNSKNGLPVHSTENTAADFFSNQNIFPRCDVYENQYGLIVEAELPGVEKGEIKVLLQQDELILKGKCNTVKQSIKYYLKERPNRTFEKKITIPISVNRHEIKSSFNNGILTIILPINRNEAENISIMVDNDESEAMS